MNYQMGEGEVAVVLKKNRESHERSHDHLLPAPPGGGGGGGGGGGAPAATNNNN